MNEFESVFVDLAIDKTKTKKVIDYSDLCVHRTNCAPYLVGERIYEATSSVGLRDSQEDRFFMIPQFFNDQTSCVGVFDGTVGNFASEFVNNNIVQQLCCSDFIKNEDFGLFSLNNGKCSMASVAGMISACMKKLFNDVDCSLIEMCAEHNLHYTSCTGITALLWNNLLTISHVGDSKACIAKIHENVLTTEWLTLDHKPNMPQELSRIEQAGGSLVWLHDNKPFIRGGDFFTRQAAGDHPKQLNYSRAFGGKDLKKYGLSSEPDVNHFEIFPDDKLLLVASDGLWDVLQPNIACEIAMKAKMNGKSATTEIVNTAVRMMPKVGVCDNITVIAIFL